MKLTQREQEKLMIVVAADLARRRKDRGLKLNYPEAAPNGTLFRYDLLRSKMEVYLEKQLVLFDHIKLEPDEDMAGIGYMEGYTHFGTMIIIDERVNKVFLEELHVLFEPLTELRIGVSMLAVPGFALRVLANSTQSIEHIQSVTHELIRK